MLSIRLVNLALLAASISLTACISTVEVKKADANTAGIRYYLPKPFLQVKTSPDGTTSVEVIYLPDPKREYAVHASSILAGYTLEVKRNEKGFLETVTFNNDNTAVAAQALSSAAAVRATEIETTTAKAKAEQVEIKAKADKATAAFAAAEKALADAELVVEIARKKLELLMQVSPKPTNISDQILSANLALSEAILRRDAASAVLASLSGDLSEANAINFAANAPLKATAGANAAAGKEAEKKTGPPGRSKMLAPTLALFEIDMSLNSVRLKQAFDQLDLDTWKGPPPSPETTELRVAPGSLVIYPAKDTKALRDTVKSNLSLKSAVFVDIRDDTKKVIQLKRPPIVSLAFDRNTIQFDFPSDIPAGDYDLRIKVTYGNDPKKDATPLSFLVRIEK
ncbi:MAG: hypothetical protein ABL931_01385 [Usitatibacteraceae bacterium]